MEGGARARPQPPERARARPARCRTRQRSPGKSDRELLEDLATIALGFETIARVQQRKRDADAVMAEAVMAVQKVRREMAERQAVDTLLDSSVLLSALAGHSGSRSAGLLTAIRTGSVQAGACPRLITELRDGLRKPYFAATSMEPWDRMCATPSVLSQRRGEGIEPSKPGLPGPASFEERPGSYRGVNLQGF